AGPFDTPERRAALEARVGQVAATIGDESVRRYYKQDLAARLRRMFAPAAYAGKESGPARRGFSDRQPGAAWFGARRSAESSRSGGPFPFSVAGGREASYVAASPQLAASPVHRGHRAAIPRREALILQAAINHPWLLHDHLEELAAAEFRHADTQKLKGALIDVFAHHFAEDLRNATGDDGEAERAALAAELIRRGFADQLERIERTVTTP